MKRVLLCLMTILSMAMTGASHAEEGVTLSEMKKTVPERLTIQCEAGGKPVSIDAPIRMPEGDKLPVLNAVWREFDTDNLVSRYPSLAQDAGDPYRQYRLYIQQQPMGGGKLEIPFHYTSREPILREETIGGQPIGNDLAPDAPLALMREILKLAGADADLRVDGQTVAGSAYYQAQIPGIDDLYMQQLPYEQIKIDPERPIRGYGVGYYKTGFAQYVDGVKVFPKPFYGAENGPYDPYLYGVGPSLDMLSEKDFRLSLQLLDITEPAEADARLLPFSEIERILRERAESGMLRSVREITLGYAAFTVTGSEAQTPATEKIVLRPFWQVRGVDAAFDQMFDNMMREDRALTDLDYEKALSGNGSDFEIRIDAVTGEVLTGVRVW